MGLSLGETAEEALARQAEELAEKAAKEKELAKEKVAKEKELELETGDEHTLEATILPANAADKRVTWSSSNEKVAFVSGSGKVVALAAGTTTIRVTSTENSEKYDECAVTVTKKDTTIYVTSVTVAPKTIALDLGGETTAQPVATVLPEDASNKNVEYTSSNPEIAFVDAKTGLITAVSEGTATITCAAENHPERNFDTCEVTVKPAPIVHVTGIELDCGEKNLAVKDTFILTAIISPSNATVKNVTWSSNHENIATVDQSGKVKGIAKGECQITATTADGGFTASCKVVVKPSVDPVPVTSISLNITSKKINVDDTFELVATVLPENADDKGHINWTSSDDSVAQVISVGPSTATIKGLKDGTATITASCGGKTATCKVTVGDQPTPPPTPVHPVESVAIYVNGSDASRTSLDVNAQLALEAIINPEEAENKLVLWSSSDEGIATIDSAGIIHPVSIGTVTITVYTVDGNKTDSIEVTVFDRKAQEQTNIIVGASVGGVAVAGAGCGIGIPLGLKAKKRKLLK